MEKWKELHQQVEACAFHSKLKDGLIVSGIHLMVPLSGTDEHLLTLSRRAVAEILAANEENYALKYFVQEIDYILLSATQYEEPIYQENEDGQSTHIGNAVVQLDRSRLSRPQVRELDGSLFLDCVRREDEKAN